MNKDFFGGDSGDVRLGGWHLYGLDADHEFLPDVQRIHDKYVDAIRRVMYLLMPEGYGDAAWDLMHYKVGHIVWDDGSTDDSAIDFSLKWAAENDCEAPPVAVWLAMRSLRELKRLPPEKRLVWSRSRDVCLGPGHWQCGSESRPYSVNPPED